MLAIATQQGVARRRVTNRTTNRASQTPVVRGGRVATRLDAAEMLADARQWSWPDRCGACLAARRDAPRARRGYSRAPRRQRVHKRAPRAPGAPPIFLPPPEPSRRHPHSTQAARKCRIPLPCVRRPDDGPSPRRRGRARRPRHTTREAGRASRAHGRARFHSGQAGKRGA